MGVPDQFCLKSDNFHEKTGKAFHTFKEGNDFTDVTLVSEDGQEIEVHKIVLTASSSFFLFLKLCSRKSIILTTLIYLVHMVDLLTRDALRQHKYKFHNTKSGRDSASSPIM